MTDTFNQVCPLCGGQAEYEIFHDPYCKHFACPVCIEFCIDGSSEDYFKSTTDEFRATASQKAKNAGSNHMLILREPNDNERKAQPQPKLMVIAEIITKQIM